MHMSDLARELNMGLESSPAILGLLSEEGKKAFFPKSGILAQTAEARGKPLNATIGIALDDAGEPLTLGIIKENSRLTPKETVLYSPSQGQPGLRRMWLDRIKQSNPSLKAKTSLPVATCGLTHAMSLIGRMFLDPGERLIMPDMFWGNYRLVFLHAELDTFGCFDGKGGFNVQGLDEKLKTVEGKQAILLNFPNNPTGYSPTMEEAEAIVESVRKSAERGNRVLVICDDAYFGLFYEKHTFKESLFSRFADLHENVLAVKVDGITKEMYAWGMRVGFITFGFRGMNNVTASILEDKTAGTIRGTVSNISTHSQWVISKALETPALKRQERENFEVLKERYEEVKFVLKDEKYKDSFEPLPFNSGYFMCVRLKKGDAEQVRKRLLEEFGTGVISMGSHLRIAFSSIRKDQIRDLFENIRKACKG